MINHHSSKFNTLLVNILLIAKAHSHETLHSAYNLINVLLAQLARKDNQKDKTIKRKQYILYTSIFVQKRITFDSPFTIQSYFMLKHHKQLSKVADSAI